METIYFFIVMTHFQTLERKPEVTIVVSLVNMEDIYQVYTGP